MKNNVKNQNRIIYIRLLLMIPILFFIACKGDSGGSSGDENNFTINGNNTPVAKAGADLIVFENKGVTLSAEGSSDENTKYKWREIDGDTISLVNNNLKELKFIAPEVNSDSVFKFRLDVTNSSGKSSSDEIEIKVINIKKESSYQEVISDKDTIKAIESNVEVPLLYNTHPDKITTTGLSIKIYWDNTKLKFTDIKDIFQTDYINHSSVNKDLTNRDNDSSTNSYITVSWVNLKDGKWNTPNLPLKLMKANFKVLDGLHGSTYINIHRAFESPQVDFYSKSTLILF